MHIRSEVEKNCLATRLGETLSAEMGEKNYKIQGHYRPQLRA